VHRTGRWCFALWLTALAAPAVAHPFHAGAEGYGTGFAHAFTGIDHVLAMIAVGIWAVQQGGSATWRVPIAFCTGMALGAVLGYLGFVAPLVEPFIAASVFALGLLILSKRSLATGYQLALIAFFALFHGMAHAMEQPTGVLPWIPLAGLLTATVLLHGGGIATATALRAWIRVTGVPLVVTGAWLLSRVVG
jgi:urease accessory protein